MAKTLKIDKSSEMVTIELDKNELKDILDSIDLMIQDQKRNQCFNAIKKIANISGAIKIIGFKSIFVKVVIFENWLQKKLDKYHDRIYYLISGGKSFIYTTKITWSVSNGF